MTREAVTKTIREHLQKSDMGFDWCLALNEAMQQELNGWTEFVLAQRQEERVELDRRIATLEAALAEERARLADGMDFCRRMIDHGKAMWEMYNKRPYGRFTSSDKHFAHAWQIASVHVLAFLRDGDDTLAKGAARTLDVAREGRGGCGVAGTRDLDHGEERARLDWWIANSTANICEHGGKFAVYNPQRKTPWCDTERAALDAARGVAVVTVRGEKESCTNINGSR